MHYSIQILLQPSFLQCISRMQSFAHSLGQGRFKQDYSHSLKEENPPGVFHSRHTMSLTLQVMVEAYRRDAISKDQLISELKSTKKRLLVEVKDLKQELLGVQGEKQKAELEQARLQKEVARVQEQMNNMEAHLEAIQTERDQLETQIQVL